MRLSVRIKRSTSPFASGCSGVTFRCSKPNDFEKSLNSLPLNGGPLSDFMVWGMPCLAKIVSNLGRTALLDTKEITSTSGYLLYSSMTTITISPLGKGPAKSIARECQGFTGSGVGMMGSLSDWGLEA